MNGQIFTKDDGYLVFDKTGKYIYREECDLIIPNRTGKNTVYRIHENRIKEIKPDLGQLNMLRNNFYHEPIKQALCIDDYLNQIYVVLEDNQFGAISLKSKKFKPLSTSLVNIELAVCNKYFVVIQGANKDNSRIKEIEVFSKKLNF